MTTLSQPTVLEPLPFPTNEAICLAVTQDIPRGQWEDVFEKNHYASAEICPEFLGFLNVYWALAHLIPTHWTVVDLGSGYNAAAFLFTRHDRFISVDSCRDTVRFATPNCTHYSMPIGDFLAQHGQAFDLRETFAICSYCPMWSEGTTEHVRRYFPNLFVYYPHHRHHPFPSLTQKTSTVSCVIP
ncbi:MAG: hypothetical protein OJF50_006411 [Nitrospira sp.]|jgi:hypothetical protein|nr:hypothetical protein [Nitrospira sp.]